MSEARAELEQMAREWGFHRDIEKLWTWHLRHQPQPVTVTPGLTAHPSCYRCGKCMVENPG